MRSIAKRALAVLIVVAFAGPASAVDYLQDALKMIVKQNTTSGKEKAVWVSKSPAIVLPSSSPIAVGATLEVIGTNEDVTVSLPAGAANWKTNGAGTLYKFVNKLAPGGPSPCKVALIKSPTVFKVVCKDSIIALDDATQGTVSMVFTVDTDRYCSTCTGGVIKKDEPGKFIAKLCPAPGVCPGATTTTTTTVTTTTVTTTTVTTTSTTVTTTTSTTTTTTLPVTPPCTPALPTPACDGDCGGPGAMCVDPGGGCVCMPTGGPCGTVVGPPTCYGDCFVPGQACIDIGGTCACDEPGPPPVCGAGLPSPFCDGACGPGAMCADPGGGCVCAPTAGPCGAVAPFPTCLGDCPPGLSCRGTFPAPPPGCACLP